MAAVTTSFESYKNHFLVAMPSLLDPHFFHSVTYILEHTPDGAMGIVVNHPLRIHLRDVLEHMEIDASLTIEGENPVFAGGPIQPERGFVLHRPFGTWQASVSVADDITITTSRDVLEAMAENRGPDNAMVALGYAGWGPNQLEIAENAWLVTPASSMILFDTPFENRWAGSARLLLGVDLSSISNTMGHA